MAICIIGRSGSGKSSLTNGLQKLFQCNVIKIGEILRTLYPLDIIIARKIPQIEIFSHLKQKIQENGTNINILDNFPTTGQQLAIYLEHFQMPLLFIHLELNEQDARERIVTRDREGDSDIDKRREFDSQIREVTQLVEPQGILVTINGKKTEIDILSEAYQHIQETLINNNITLHEISQTPNVVSSGYGKIIQEK